MSQINNDVWDKYEALFAAEPLSLAAMTERRTHLPQEAFLSTILGASLKLAPKLVQPYAHLKKTDDFPLKIYLRMVLQPVALIMAITFFVVSALMGITFAVIVLQHPSFIHGQNMHRLYGRILYHLQSPELYERTLPILAFFALLNAIGNFPRFYFWNRRAKRLRRQQSMAPVIPDQSSDTTTWPPAPHSAP